MNWRHLIGICAALLPLCACQAVTPGAHAAPQSCTAEQITSLPIRWERGFLLVPGRIDDHPIQLLVDTGSERTVISLEASKQYHLDHDPQRHSTLLGTGGQITTTNVRVPLFAVGRMEMLDQSMAVGLIPSFGNLDPPISGLLGADFLSDFDLDLDIPRQLLTLYRVKGCDSDFMPWSHAATLVPMRRLYNNLLAAEIQIEGHPVAALIDTGANTSILGMQTAQRWGIDAAALAHDQITSSTGVDGNAVVGHMHQFKELRIGAMLLRDQTIEVAPLRFGSIEMLLGIDFLQSHHIFLSYTTRRLFVAQPGL